MTIPIWKSLGKQYPAGALSVLLYEVPTGRQCSLSQIVACNCGANTTIRIRILVAGASTGSGDYLYYDYALNAANSLVHHWPLYLSVGDQIWVESAGGTVAFNAFGEEVFV